ncbi:hypothetical protein VT50_0224260 [Streptomyces antioxidans]|uniref:Uncharacterized protein n=1 Tax=Streptomyces antioxidans TaxID=1507734 RepID=A0A1V4D0G3_9ACTN|nr:hypothetical protein VT50_0224260 [Streptomyces antioxidans]
MCATDPGVAGLVLPTEPRDELAETVRLVPAPSRRSRRPAPGRSRSAAGPWPGSPCHTSGPGGSTGRSARSFRR